MKKYITIQAAAAQAALFGLFALIVLFICSDSPKFATFVLIKVVGFLLAGLFYYLWKVFKSKGWLDNIEDFCKEED